MNQKVNYYDAVEIWYEWMYVNQGLVGYSSAMFCPNFGSGSGGGSTELIQGEHPAIPIINRVLSDFLNGSQTNKKRHAAFMATVKNRFVASENKVNQKTLARRVGIPERTFQRHFNRVDKQLKTTLNQAGVIDDG